MPQPNESEMQMVRFLEGADGFSEFRSTDIGLKYSVTRALEWIRVTRAGISNEGGLSIFIDAVQAAELRFYSYLKTFKPYIAEIKNQQTNPAFKAKDVQRILATKGKDLWGLDDEDVGELQDIENSRIMRLRAERMAFIIFDWIAESGLDLERQIIPENMVNEPDMDEDEEEDSLQDASTPDGGVAISTASPRTAVQA